ncbi:MAG TPA: PAS domain-containing sensor histidine kinase [Ktedonobacterales bacterium]|nr:PAS domain-containing sensor histidine kinase [Ktedonobacterales bacterium]
MQAAAIRAARSAQPYSRVSPGHRLDGAPDSVVMSAVPFGSSRAHTVLVVRGTQTDREQVQTLLRDATDGLLAATRVAWLARQVERADRRNVQLQAMFTNSSEAILTVDQDFHIVEANPASSTLLEWNAHVPLGQHCSTVLMCRDEHGQLLCGTLGCPLVQAFVLTDAAPYRDVTWQTANGNHKEVSASFASVAAPDGRRGVISARDMTRVNVADHTRSHFMSMVSHELRTPLNSINGFLEIVLEGQAGLLNPKQEEFLTYAHMGTHQLMTLVEDTLFISRADTGQFKLRFDTVAIPDLIAQTVRNCLTAAQRAEVELCVRLPDALPTLFADEFRLQQVLSNLINNAIKFTPPHGVVTVRVEVWPSDLCIDVCDTGEGVPLEEQLRIFERFYQSASPTHIKTGGYGLGLAIAKLIVQQHGGRIWVTSGPNEGATFSFTIPLATKSAQDALMASEGRDPAV